MSILIKGTKMPESCSKCILNKGTSCGITGTQWETRTWILLDFDCNKQTLDDCPLVEVPTPHGNLVDLDKMIDKYWDVCCMDIWESDLPSIPIVIEAEAEE